MEILQDGLLFIYTPVKKNCWKSVLRHKSFVDEALQALLDQGLVRESNIIPDRWYQAEKIKEIDNRSEVRQLPQNWSKRIWQKMLFSTFTETCKF